MDLFEQFGRKGDLMDRSYTGYADKVITVSDVYDTVGGHHQKHRGANETLVVESMHEILQDTSSLLSYNQLLTLHRRLPLEDQQHCGVLRTTPAVGYASHRVYRSFLPANEVIRALNQAIHILCHSKLNQAHPLVRVYYIFSVLVFYIHPFHDGNGRCARLIGNVVARKLGYPFIFKASDKTIQFDEMLHKSLGILQMEENLRRARHQRGAAPSRSNTTMWF